jgi:hypothetical protein
MIRSAGYDKKGGNFKVLKVKKIIVSMFAMGLILAVGVFDLKIIINQALIDETGFFVFIPVSSFPPISCGRLHNLN